MLSEDRLAFVLSLDLYSLDFINIPATLHYGNLETQPTIIICEKITSDYEKLGEIFRNNNSQIYFYYKKNSAHNGKDLIINPDNLSVTLWILMDKRKNSLFITFVILVNICGKCSEYPTHFTSTLMKCHCKQTLNQMSGKQQTFLILDWDCIFLVSHLAPLALPQSSGSPLTWNQWLESVTQLVQFMETSSGSSMMHLFLNWPMYTWSRVEL